MLDSKATMMLWYDTMLQYVEFWMAELLYADARQASPGRKFVPETVMTTGNLKCMTLGSKPNIVGRS
jgi:hypothetical protein